MNKAITHSNDTGFSGSTTFAVCVAAVVGNLPLFAFTTLIYPNYASESAYWHSHIVFFEAATIVFFEVATAIVVATLAVLARTDAHTTKRMFRAFLLGTLLSSVLNSFIDVATGFEGVVILFFPIGAVAGFAGTGLVFYRLSQGVSGKRVLKGVIFGTIVWFLGIPWNLACGVYLCGLVHANSRGYVPTLITAPVSFSFTFAYALSFAITARVFITAAKLAEEAGKQSSG